MGGGDLAVKGNQPSLHNAVRAALAESTKKPLSKEMLSVEKEHGRIDGREYAEDAAICGHEQSMSGKGTGCRAC